MAARVRFEADGVDRVHDGGARSARPGRARAARLLALLPLAALSAIAVMMAVVRLRQGLNAGWDTYAFLCNAIDMAGRSVGYVEPGRPPFMLFLTSLVMRMGVWSETSLLIVELALSAVGVVSLYFLLSRRFSRWMAAAGSVLLLGMPPFWSVLGTGYTDFPSVALSICAVLFTVKATEEDARWYWAAFPLLIAAFLTRFGSLLMVVPILMWLMLRARPFRDAKHIGQGILAAILVYIPAGLYFRYYQGDALAPFQLAGNVAAGDFAVGGQLATGAGAATNAFVIPGRWYFENIRFLIFPKSMGVLAVVLLVATGAGLLVAAAAALSPARTRWRWLVPVCAAAVAIAAQAFGDTMMRMLTILALGFAVAWSTRPRANDGIPQGADDVHWALDAVVMTWGLIFLDAHGHMATQIDRYFLTMAPAVLYFLLIGWRALTGLLVRSLTVNPPRLHEADTHSGAAWANGIAFVALALTAAAAVPPGVSAAPPNKDAFVAELADSAAWLRSNVPGIRQESVVSDCWPHMSWFLGQNVQPMQLFPDPKAFPWELEKRRVDYYVTVHPSDYPKYKVVYTRGRVSVLERETAFETRTPRVAYLGRGWDTYLEIVGGYDFEFMFPPRRGPIAEEWGLDRLTVEELATYNAVAIYGATWEDLPKAERNLEQYVDRGGVVIIDASRNMSGLQNSLVDTVFLDVLIRREQVPADGRIMAEGGLVRASGSTSAVDASPFLDESDGPWFGATYEPFSRKTSLRVIARLNGHPVVQVQTIGRGRIYWISDNLVWHAFLTKNAQEADLVRGVMRSALDLPPLQSPLVARRTPRTGE